MTSTPTQPSQGTQAPNQIELLWLRYKPLVNIVLLAIIAALGINYALAYMSRQEADKSWSSFSANIGLQKAYGEGSNQMSGYMSLTEEVASLDAAALTKALGEANDAQKPYVLLALARRAIVDGNWAEAEQRLKDLETQFPNHDLVRSTPYPVQARAEEKPPETDDSMTNPPDRDEPKWKPVAAGSVVSRVREQIQQGQGFQLPAKFAAPPTPTDGTKVKFDLSNDYGSFTVLLLADTPKHREAFLKLAQSETPFWKGLAIDEIRRPTKLMRKLPRELHLGFESTKEDDSTKWNTKDPSKNQVDFESSALSHFQGAVSARNEADGKSCADRFWIAVDETPVHDGERTIFAWVVDGLDNLKRVCEATMSAQEEEQGRGKPSQTIRVTAVTVLQ